MKKIDFVQMADKIFFKHEVSENLPSHKYRMHTHSTYEVLYFLDGDATYIVEDRKYKLKKGDMIFTRPLQCHSIQIDSPARYERYGILFDAEKLGVESAALLPEDLDVINLSGHDIMEHFFHKCDLYRQRCSPELFEKILTHLLSELFYNIALFPPPLSPSTTTTSPLISKALKYINENICAIQKIEEIAEHLFVSESYLFRLFQKELHQTPKKYILEKRLILAQKMLSAGEKSTIVCERCGFGDYATFYRNYHAFFGHSPSLSVSYMQSSKEEAGE
jgi:AraC-like DNA-binding protein